MYLFQPQVNMVLQENSPVSHFEGNKAATKDFCTLHRDCSKDTGETGVGGGLQVLSRVMHLNNLSCSLIFTEPTSWPVESICCDVSLFVSYSS